MGNNANLAKLFRMMIEATETILHNHYNEVKNEHPDYIIHDSFCCWAKYLAASLHIPAISSITIFVTSRKRISKSKEMVAMLYRIFILGFFDLIKGLNIQKNIAKEYHIKKFGLIDAFMNKEDLNIVYTSQDFQPNSSMFDSTFRFVGPSINNREENNDILIPSSNTLPVIYISLGTVVNLNEAFYRMCFQSLAGMKLLVILSVGNKIDIGSLNDAPPNFIVRSYVSQLDILSYADCFITHGGMNSVHEGLYYGVPLIAVPLTQEQKDVAERIEATKTGILLRNVSPESIKEAILDVLNTYIYKENALKMSESFKSAGGYVRAADEIILFKRHKGIKS
jgi:MGT family glycosyltransferase